MQSSSVVEPRALGNRDMRVLIFAFALLFTTAAALSGAAGLLVMASLFLAARSTQSDASLNIHLIVSGIFLGIAVLTIAIELQILGLAKAVGALEVRAGRHARMRLSRLLGLLGIAGLFLCCVMALITFAILSRIDEGFAVFG